MDMFVGDARQHGGKVNAGGATLKVDGKPTGSTTHRRCCRTCRNEARIMNEEPFGPVAIINPFSKFEDAITQAIACLTDWRRTRSRALEDCESARRSRSKLE